MFIFLMVTFLVTITMVIVALSLALNRVNGKPNISLSWLRDIKKK